MFVFVPNYNSIGNQTGNSQRGRQTSDYFSTSKSKTSQHAFIESYQHYGCSKALEKKPLKLIYRDLDLK